MKTAIETYSDLDTAEEKALYMASCASLMDSDIADTLNGYGLATDKIFLRAYCAEHKEKFNEEFVVN